MSQNNAVKKVVQLLLINGNLQGIIQVNDNTWEGELYAAPRESVDTLLEVDACNRTGVYLLLSEEKVYIGQASDLRKRTEEHKLDKDWWNRVVLLTTQTNKLNKTDIDYIENVLINKALKNSNLDVDNKTRGNKFKLDVFQRTILDSYIDGALFLLELIGCNVFSEKKTVKVKNDTSNNTVTVGKIAEISDEEKDLRSKSETLQFLTRHGYNYKPNSCTYAKLQEKKNVFWANPDMKLLKQDWIIILNNQKTNTISILNVPANTFETGNKSKENKLMLRTDKKHNTQIDLNLDNDYVDVRSGCNFSRFLIEKICYKTED